MLKSTAQTAALALTLVVSACADDRACEDEIRIAASVTVQAPAGVTVDKVTIEKVSEELCGLTSTRGTEKLHQCWEQGGGGTYVVRVYSGGRVWSSAEDIEGEDCHVRERRELSFDLSMEP